jgi:excisionase family DNA binding protein
VRELSEAILNGENLPDMLTVKEAAAYLRIDRKGAYELLPKMGIPLIKYSERRTRVPKAAVLGYLAKQSGNMAGA